MKSKSFDLTQSCTEKQKLNKTLDFVGLYKSAAETNKVAEKRKSGDNLNKETPKNKLGSSSRERSPDKNRRKHKQVQLDVSEISIDGSNLNSNFGGSSPTSDSKVTSTPITSTRGQSQSNRVKSIMKNASVTADHSLETTQTETPSTNKSKKRNKSVSFMLEDHEEVAIKKTKSEDTLHIEKNNTKLKDKRKHLKKVNKLQSGKEHKLNPDNTDVDIPKLTSEKKSKKEHLPRMTLASKTSTDSTMPETEIITQEIKKKLKKPKKLKIDASSGAAKIENNNNEVTTESKSKRLKKKKRQHKPATDKSDMDGEPASKNRKEDKPDISEDLENLSIGDNAHTLTNLLDEMTVVDKDRRKKNKQKCKKSIKPKATTSSPEPGDSQKNEEGKEKIRWKRRKWNRDKKGDMNEESVNTSVIVENLPLSIMLTYKKLLTDYFVKYGLIRKIGIAEVYTTEESKPVFTTTIFFYSDGAAKMALEENNTKFEGSRIRVKRPLPATQTTLAVRSYAELTDQALSSAFLGAGRIRGIRHLVKGKKSLATAFIEFDGPESVERAIKMAANTKIGGKKIHVAKFELRQKKDKDRKARGDGDSAVEADSEDSND